MIRNRGGFEGGLLDEFRRMEHEMEQLFGAGGWPSGIRSVARGSYPPIHIGSTPDQVDVGVRNSGLGALDDVAQAHHIGHVWKYIVGPTEQQGMVTCPRAQPSPA